MAFHDQPLTLHIHATAGNPVQLAPAVLVVRYALLKGEPAPKITGVLNVWRAGGQESAHPKTPSLWTVKDLGTDGQGHLIQLSFDGKALVQEITKAAPCKEARNLYEAIVGQATVQLELDIGKMGPDEHCKLTGQGAAHLFVKFDPEFA
jgi:hypothetical protein